VVGGDSRESETFRREPGVVPPWVTVDQVPDLGTEVVGQARGMVRGMGGFKVFAWETDEQLGEKAQFNHNLAILGRPKESSNGTMGW
jgi:hypothetical protein